MERLEIDMKKLTTALAAAAFLALALLAVPRGASAQEPLLGQIKLIAFNFPPKGWAFCDGQLMAINQNQALFSLLGTTYGGDGRQTFALPDLRGRIPVGMGQGPGLQNYTLGQRGGEEFHTLTVAELPAHSHPVYADGAPGSSALPTGALPARNGSATPDYGSPPNATLAPASLGSAGGGQPHENRKPTLTLHYIIALQGVFPSQSAPAQVGAK